MIGKNFIYDGVAIPYTTQEGAVQGWYADVDWTNVAVRNQQLPRQDFHGVYSFPTFAEGRLVNVKGEIFSAEKSTRGTIRNIVKNLFKIADFSTSADFKELHFTDDDGSEWFMRCKVYNMPDFTHSRAYPVINFNVQLFAQDPLIRSKNKKTDSGNYGLWGGTILPVTLPVHLSGSYNHFEMENAGNFASPVKFTVEVPSTVTSAQNIDIFQENQNSKINVADVLANEKLSYRFTPTRDKIAGVSLYISKTGSPTDYLVVEIRKDSPSGEVLGSASLVGTSITTGDVETFFEIPADIMAGTDYYCVVRRNGALDGSNYYNIRHSDVDDGSDDGGVYDGTIWSDWDRQIYFKSHYANSIVNPKIYNLSANTFFQINETLNVGDILVVDSEAVTATLNGVNVMASRVNGSNWIFALSGENSFLLAGENFDSSNQGQATLEIEFYDTNL